ncbi:MAG: tetratricopeptide repeat protein [Ignavibacteriae bacterium]|nr:tetratricopeptide repeat protein [Ignavibacteriota bacterium]
MDEQELIKEQLEKNPKDADLWYLLGNTYQVESYSFAEQKMFDEKRNCYEKAIKCNPFHNDARFALAQMEELRNWEDGALTHYEYIKKRTPEYPTIDECIRRCEEKKSNWHSKDIPRFVEKVKENPTDANANRQLGYLYWSQKQYDLALKYHTRAFELAPGESESAAFLAITLAAMKNFREAITYCLIQLSLEEDEGEQGVILRHIGEYYTELKEYAKAREYYFKALEKFSDDPQFQAYTKEDIGFTFYMEEHDETALVYLLDALSQQTDEHYIQPLLSKIGELYCRMSKFQEALPYLQRAVTLKKDDDKSFYVLGIAYSSLDEFGLAETAYKMALNANPRFDRALHNLALIYRRNGDYTTAIELFKQAIASNPDLLLAYSNLARIYLRLQDEEQAAIYLEEYLKRGGKEEDLY